MSSVKAIRKPKEGRPSVITANVIFKTYTFTSTHKNAIYFNFVTVGCSQPYSKNTLIILLLITIILSYKYLIRVKYKVIAVTVYIFPADYVLGYNCSVQLQNLVAKKHKKAILYSSLLIECIWQIFI
jgi:hypothetical protein